VLNASFENDWTARFWSRLKIRFTSVNGVYGRQRITMSEIFLPRVFHQRLVLSDEEQTLCSALTDLGSQFNLGDTRGTLDLVHEIGHLPVPQSRSNLTDVSDILETLNNFQLDT
jgi:hypothetical protein